MSYSPKESEFETGPVSSAPPAQSAVQDAERRNSNASPSESRMTALAGTAGTAASPAASVKISEAAIAWARNVRGLSPATLEQLSVGSGTAFFPDLEAKSEALVYRYPEGWKARAFPQKAFVAGKGFKLSFWNIERVLRANPARVYLTEGENDACALVEAGLSPDAVLSVPNGAKERPADNPQETRGYDYVTEALRDGLNRVKHFVWCGDSDGSGYSLRADMVKLLGAARFHFVEWPDGCKDANEFLLTDGGSAVRDLVEFGSLPWPVTGLYRMSELPEPAPLTLWNPGFPEWESKVRLSPRMLSIVTGQPGHGKTIFFAQLWFQIVQAYGIPMAVASFETRAKPHLRRQLRTLYSHKPEPFLDDDEIRKADAWIEDHYLFMAHPNQQPTLKWFLDLAEVAVVRHGARIIQLDPWNRLEGDRTPQESETDYIGRCLRTLHSFAHDMNCHVQIVAHPSKMDASRKGNPAPLLSDISGSKNWENMADQGFTVYRPEVFDGKERKTEAVLYHRKARFEELGYPCKLNMNYVLNSGRYVSTDYDTTGLLP